MPSPESVGNRSSVTFVVLAVLAVWLALVFLLGRGGAFLRPPGAPPLPILVGGVTPIIAFLAAFSASRAFRDLVLGSDLRLMTGIQAWRFAGFGFLALYAQGVLPGLFAWPAGLGDMAIAVSGSSDTQASFRRAADASHQRG